MTRAPEQEGPVAKEYGKLAIEREVYLSRGRECARLTIPSLLPREGAKNQRIVAPYQGVGARGVNNLAAKLMLALFPPNMPFFRLAIDDFALRQLANSDQARGEIEKALTKVERAVAMEVETSALRVPIFEALKHLVVVGNILLFRDPATGKSRAIPLTNYVCRRDPLGQLLKLLIREEIALSILPEDIAAKIKAASGNPEQETAILYTSVTREPNRWVVKQEAGSVELPVSGGYPLDRLPWLPLRMIVVDGEDYGRGFVEEHYSDLNSLEKLTKALVQFAAASAKIVFGVKPNATTKVRDLSKAESGDFVNGDLEKDVTVLQLQKQGDFAVTKSTADTIEERLAYAFMLNSALQRNGERVTAEEIRRLAAELDTSLGGIHALLAQELQLPLVSIIMAAKQRKRELPKLPKGFVRPLVVTGVEALGRGSDYDNLLTAVQALALVPDAQQRLKGDEYGKRVFASLQVNSDGLFKTDEEVAQEQAQAAAAEMAKAATPVAAKAMTEGTPE